MPGRSNGFGESNVAGREGEGRRGGVGARGYGGKGLFVRSSGDGMWRFFSGGEVSHAPMLPCPRAPTPLIGE